jgi:hypothetical protein
MCTHIVSLWSRMYYKEKIMATMAIFRDLICHDDIGTRNFTIDFDYLWILGSTSFARRRMDRHGNVNVLALWLLSNAPKSDN